MWCRNSIGQWTVCRLLHPVLHGHYGSMQMDGLRFSCYTLDAVHYKSWGRRHMSQSRHIIWNQPTNRKKDMWGAATRGSKQVGSAVADWQLTFLPPSPSSSPKLQTMAIFRDADSCPCIFLFSFGTLSIRALSIVQSELHLYQKSCNTWPWRVMDWLMGKLSWVNSISSSVGHWPCPGRMWEVSVGWIASTVWFALSSLSDVLFVT